ncbi:Phage head maturation protease [Desulfitobacterium hafniense]|uniref:Phage head maturation protease n=1 Tax=Desulfitobacterium hafniense TaxID=49338 RepID=A0A098AU90_DESHA|nr:HK97 family phage prohead protease [Desulfitobacterium hafniense]CDV96359.1 Phage head maturation protease [Desulfitobacterium hafniense]
MSDRGTRQARSLSTQYRAIEEDGKKIIEGYFAVFGSVYQLWPGATESVAETAFDGALADDIRALTDHETRLVLGRNKAGTLELRVDSRGLWGRIELNPSDQDAMNLYARVERGDVDQCSFGFDILDEDVRYGDDGSVHWTIKSVKLYEVSVVTFPAYVDTSVQARKKDFEQIQVRKTQETQNWKARTKERLSKWH